MAGTSIRISSDRVPGPGVQFTIDGKRIIICDGLIMVDGDVLAIYGKFCWLDSKSQSR